MLHAVEALSPSLLPLGNWHSSPSSLSWGDKIILSSEGVEQEDPLGPLHFCLSLYRLHFPLKSEFVVFCLDDIILGGDVDDVLYNVDFVDREVGEFGLHLNHCKSEVICRESSTTYAILSSVPGMSAMDPEQMFLLGSPKGGITSVSFATDDKYCLLKVLEAQLQRLLSHSAISSSITHWPFQRDCILSGLFPLSSLPICSPTMLSSDPP